MTGYQSSGRPWMRVLFKVDRRHLAIIQIKNVLEVKITFAMIDRSHITVPFE